MKNSKVILTILIIILVALIAIGAYTIGKNQQKDVNKLEDNITNSIQESSSSNYVSDLYSEQYDNHTYKIPKININSTYATQVNSKMTDIKENATKSIEAYKKEKQTGYLPSDDSYDIYPSISYKYYLNNNILSIIVMEKMEYGNYYNYEIFNIDVNSGNKYTNNQILKNSNINVNDFQDKIYGFIVSNKEDWYSVVDERFYTTKDDCSIEKCELVFLDNGIIAAAISIGGTDVSGKQLININTGKVIDITFFD